MIGKERISDRLLSSVGEQQQSRTGEKARPASPERGHEDVGAKPREEDAHGNEDRGAGGVGRDAG